MLQFAASNWVNNIAIVLLAFFVVFSTEEIAHYNRLHHVLVAQDPTIRATIAQDLDATVQAAGTTAVAVPAQYTAVLPACTAASTDPICGDTINVTATLSGATVYGAGGVTTVLPNVNTATGFDATTGASGTPVQEHATYAYIANLTTPGGVVIASKRGIAGYTILNATTNEIVMDSTQNPTGLGYGGNDAATTMGNCDGSDGACSLNAQATPQPGVGTTDTRVYAQLLCGSTAQPMQCHPTGNATPSPQPRNAFGDVTQTDTSNQRNWPSQ